MRSSYARIEEMVSFARCEDSIEVVQIAVEDDQDFSDMVAEHAARQKRKRKTDDGKPGSKPSKKHKDFKF